jgi:hypothetical protein
MRRQRKNLVLFIALLMILLSTHTVLSLADVEPNNNIDQAEVIQQGDYEGSLSANDTRDIYEYLSKGNTDIRVDVHPSYTLLLAVKIYMKDGIVITEGATANHSDLITLYLLNPVAGAYYIEVSDLTNITGVYSLEVREVLTLSTLKIHVVDMQGNPIEDADVISTNQPADQPTLSGMTESDGRIIFSGISYGNYTFEVSKTGYQTVTVGESFESNVRAEISITLPVNPDIPLNPTPSGLPGYVYFIFGAAVFGVGWYILRRWIGDSIFRPRTGEVEEPSNF